jgi:hypothetical protein
MRHDRTGELVDHDHGQAAAVVPSRQADLDQARADLVDALRTDPAFGSVLRWAQADYALQEARRKYADARWLTQHGQHSPEHGELTRPAFTEVIDRLLREALGLPPA